MNNEGPEINSLTHRIAECPPEFYETPLGPADKKNPIALNVRAIFSDHLRDLKLDPSLYDNEIKTAVSAAARCKRMILIAIWLLRDPWLMKNVESEKIPELLANGLSELAEVVVPEKTISDPDRREELARICLRELGFRPAGESLKQSTDRLNTLDSAERIRVINKTRAAEARARKIREAMAKKAAEEAATRYSPE